MESDPVGDEHALGAANQLWGDIVPNRQDEHEDRARSDTRY